MRCEACGKQYEAPVAEAECATRCRHYGQCDLSGCPNCFSENVLEPEWYARTAAARPA